MRKSNWPDRNATPLDPVALSLALWLAAIVAMAGISRLHLPTQHGVAVETTVADSYRMALAFGG